MSERKIVQIHTEYNEQSGHGVYVVCEDGTAWIRTIKGGSYAWIRIEGPPAEEIAF